MRAGRFLTPLLAGATILLLVCNVLPASARRHRLETEHAGVLLELSAERERALRLQAEIEALTSDPFVLERALVETWNEDPEGALDWDDAWAVE